MKSVTHILFAIVIVCFAANVANAGGMTCAEAKKAFARGFITQKDVDEICNPKTADVPKDVPKKDPPKKKDPPPVVVVQPPQPQPPSDIEGKVHILWIWIWVLSGVMLLALILILLVFLYARKTRKGLYALAAKVAQHEEEHAAPPVP